MNAGERAVAAARAAIGTRYRLHGHDPATGLDCVGLAAVALRAAGVRLDVPRGYALRCGDVARVTAALDAAGLAKACEARPGDLVLLRAGAGQLHFAVQSETGMVHADAMLRRVVERSALPWPVIGRWRPGEGD